MPRVTGPAFTGLRQRQDLIRTGERPVSNLCGPSAYMTDLTDGLAAWGVTPNPRPQRNLAAISSSPIMVANEAAISACAAADRVIGSRAAASEARTVSVFGRAQRSARQLLSWELLVMSLISRRRVLEA
jgi:hypothetical protein